MSIALHIKTTILPGSRIEISSPELPQGRPASVFVIVDDDAPVPKQKLSEVLSSAVGSPSFRTSDEVDAYLRVERESWGS